MNLFRQTVALCLLAAAVAAGLHIWQPVTLDWSAAKPGPGQITWELAQALAQKQPVLWVDARSAEKFAAGHVPGAVNLRPAAWEVDLPAVLKQWTPASALVVYCDDAGCGTSEAVAAQLRGPAGLPQVYVLFGGWAEAPAALGAQANKGQK